MAGNGMRLLFQSVLTPTDFAGIYHLRQNKNIIPVNSFVLLCLSVYQCFLPSPHAWSRSASWISGKVWRSISGDSSGGKTTCGNCPDPSQWFPNASCWEQIIVPPMIRSQSHSLWHWQQIPRMIVPLFVVFDALQEYKPIWSEYQLPNQWEDRNWNRRRCMLCSNRIALVWVVNWFYPVRWMPEIAYAMDSCCGMEDWDWFLRILSISWCSPAPQEYKSIVWLRKNKGGGSDLSPGEHHFLGGFISSISDSSGQCRFDSSVDVIPISDFRLLIQVFL